MILALSGVWLVLVSIIAFILILGVIIIVHEGGHFFFARRAGVLCHEFSIGMGPAIYKKKFKETTFYIRAIPIGGYVSMAGEEITDGLVKIGERIGLNLLDGKVSEIVTDENADAEISGDVVDFDLYGKEGEPLYITINDGMQESYYEVMENAFYVFKKGDKMQITPYNRSFESKTIWQRFLTLFAGPFMNFVLAILIYLIVSFATGVPNYDSTVIGTVDAGNSNLVLEENQMKLQEGDVIKKVNDTNVLTWNEFSTALNAIKDKNKTTFQLTIERDGKEQVVDIECTTNIVSLGLSNLQVENKPFPEGIKGVRVGNIGLRYQDDSKKGEYPMAKGDIITKMRVDIVHGKEVTEGSVVDVVSWEQLIETFKDIDIARVYFEYYSYEKGDIVTIEQSAPLETYGDELLDNQRIDKILIQIGISPTMKFNFLKCTGNAFVNFWDDFTLIFRTLKLLIAPAQNVKQVGVSDLSSFVGIFDLIKTFIGSGLLTLLAFTAMLSVNIGVMNLLPIPALDGGRIVFLGYELVTKKKVSRKVENIVNNVFFILLLILFVFVTYNDIVRMIRKG